LKQIPKLVSTNFQLFFIFLSGVRLSPLVTAATTGLLYQPRRIDDGDCGAINGMKIGRGNRSTRRKSFPIPLSPHDSGSNPGRHGGKPATNHLRYGSATSKKKGKAVPVTGRGDPYGRETSRLPHLLDSRLTDRGKVVCLTRRSPFILRKIPGTHFC
jgi:hypothetical protein